MISIDPAKIKEQRIALDAHRHALPDSYIADKLRDTSMFMDEVYQDLINNGYCIIERQKGDRTNDTNTGGC